MSLKQTGATRGNRRPAGPKRRLSNDDLVALRSARAAAAGRRERIDDAVDDLLDQHLVLAFAHDADHRLGTRRAHDQPTMTVETGLRILDGAAHLGVLERLAARVAHVLEHLRQRIEPVADFGYRL